ncbi:MAG: O-antigen ligase family protein [Chloroflexota bacterium]
MTQIKQRNQILLLLAVFLILLLSNVSVLFRMLWLIENVVFVQAGLFFLFAAGLIFVLYREELLGELVAGLKRNWFVFPFLLFALASIFWSINKEVSTARWVIFLSTLLISGYLGLSYSTQEILRIVSAFSLQVLFLAALIILIYPSFGIMNYYSIQGAWSGIFWHKNHMGLFASFINIIFFINLVESILKSSRAKYLWGAVYIFSLFFIFKTDSVAAYFSTIFLHGVYLVLFIWLRIRHTLKAKHYIFFLILMILAAILIGMNLDVLFGLFNRSTTLTGRIPMWSHVFDTYFVERPYFGYGFNAFWYPYAHRVEIQQVAGYPDPVMIADNGFIDILINTGVVGLVLFIVLYFGICWRALQILRNSKSTLALFPIIIMAFTLISNISWSLIFENESFFMLLMMTILFMGNKSKTESLTS